jgi:hypothetical protein
MAESLTTQESQSPAWLKVKDRLMERIDTLRKQNDSTQSPEATERLRGAINECKSLLAWGKD